MSQLFQKSKQLDVLSSIRSDMCTAIRYSMHSKAIESLCRCAYHDLDAVYHSETMCEMEVKADLYRVDLCNPYVLMFLAKHTAYHHAYWPHTKKRFTAFKNILRYDKLVKKSFGDMKFYALITGMLDEMLKTKDNPLYNTPGARQHLKNVKQVVEIVEKAIANGR